MTAAQDHFVTIERRGRSHRALCVCGWVSHAWNELRPAEADAWHHVYGDQMIVDATETIHAPSGRPSVEVKQPSRSLNVEHLVRKAQDLAGKPSPYGQNAYSELWHTADHDTATIRAAVAEVEKLLTSHDRQSSRTADSEWLQLITAKRLLMHALALSDESGTPRALL